MTEEGKNYDAIDRIKFALIVAFLASSVLIETQQPPAVHCGGGLLFAIIMRAPTPFLGRAFLRRDPSAPRFGGYQSGRFLSVRQAAQ